MKLEDTLNMIFKDGWLSYTTTTEPGEETIISIEAEIKESELRKNLNEIAIDFHNIVEGRSGKIRDFNYNFIKLNEEETRDMLRRLDENFK